MSKNRLSEETSPYLLQHKDNPVHWWPWGTDALEEAQITNRPILLSIGYAACHWCHVMAHESFEDQETADVMNKYFINIKVDREERPDIDTIYMKALHMMGQQGGWPLTMFLTPDAKPFWGGTYFPKNARFGRTPFISVLRQVERAFQEEKEKIEYNTENIIRHLQPPEPNLDARNINEVLIKEAFQHLQSIVDPVNGGIQGAPKFPQGSFFSFLWRSGLRFDDQKALDDVVNALVHICQGGIYDHLGGGFARYSVDAKWLVPHFEKMLYDNAQLLDLMTEAWRETGNSLFAKRIEETAEWLLREMIAEGGGFASSLDADSEGEEGKFYVWSHEEILKVLGPEDGKFFSEVYDATPFGNWEGKVILNRLNKLEYPNEAQGSSQEDRLEPLKAKLLEVRDGRIRPGWDDKVLADWNGLMIAALARTASAFDRKDWLDAAVRAYEFVANTMIVEGRLRHAARKGKAGTPPATSSDYANMISASLSLFQVTGKSRYLDQAEKWCETLNRHYWDQTHDGYFFAADDTADVIVRTKDAFDDAVPNANGVMISNLTALWLLTEKESYQQYADKILRAFAGDVARNLVSHSGLLCCAMEALRPAHIVIVGRASAKSKDDRLQKAFQKVSVPGAVIQTAVDPAALALKFPAIDLKDDQTGYVCIGPKCSAPVHDWQTLVETIKKERSVHK